MVAVMVMVVMMWSFGVHLVDGDGEDGASLLDDGAPLLDDGLEP